MPKLSVEKTLLLDKYLSIGLAVIDYSFAKERGRMVLDGYDHVIETYEWQRNRLRKFHAKRQLDLLIKRVEQDLEWKFFQPDYAEFIIHIRKETGEDLDLITPVRAEIESITKRRTIENNREHRLVLYWLQYLRGTDPESSILSGLEELLTEGGHLERPSQDRVVVEEYEKDGYIVQEICVTSGRGGRDSDRSTVVSPDRNKRLTLSRYSSKHGAFTSVNLQLAKGSGCIYQANINSADITVSWKDNSAVVIKTSNDFEAPIRVEKAVSYGEQVSIIYEELAQNE